MAKGANFEREFSKRLSLWWTLGQRDDVFWRTPGSGGRSTVRAKAGAKADVGAGDIIALDPIGKPLLDLVTIELKNGYKEDVLAKILRGKGNLPKFVIQARNAAAIAQTKWWWLVWKMPVGIEYLFAPTSFFVNVVHGFKMKPNVTIKYIHGVDEGFVSVVQLGDFLQRADARERLLKWQK